MLNKSHILPNILNGAKFGILSQFISDIMISLLSNNEKIIINDIKISEISQYYASCASGMMAGFLSIYLDPFAMVLFTTITYAYVFNFFEVLLKNNDFIIKPKEIVFDTIISVILIYSFDDTAHSQYLRYKQKRNLIEPTIKRRDRNLFQSVFFIILVSTYGFLKSDNYKSNSNNTGQWSEPYTLVWISAFFIRWFILFETKK